MTRALKASVTKIERRRSPKNYGEGDRILFGKAVQKIRLAKGLSQEEVSRKSKVERSTISNVERGRNGAFRETAIRLGFGLQLNKQERNHLLVIAGYSTPDQKRKAVKALFKEYE